MLHWFFYTRFGQWFDRLRCGWCHISKDDPRFVVTSDEYVLGYEGDPESRSDHGGIQRITWKEWIIFRMICRGRRRFVVIDTYNGERIACFKQSKSSIFAIRAGHEPGEIRIGALRISEDHVDLHPEFLTRWREGQPWPLGIPKEHVRFI